MEDDGLPLASGNRTAGDPDRAARIREMLELARRDLDILGDR
jgi:hypothetical protein